MQYQAILTLARELLHYDLSTGAFTWIKSRQGHVQSGSSAGYVCPHGYVRICIGQHRIYAHRLAWLMHYGKPPKLGIDHINGVRSDNRIGNLRDVTTRTNAENRVSAGPRKAGGRLLGAHWSKVHGRWKSCIGADGKSKHLGWFATEAEAHEAYVAAKRQLHGGCTI